jgi:hypothetical protein
MNKPRIVKPVASGATKVVEKKAAATAKPVAKPVAGKPAHKPAPTAHAAYKPAASKKADVLSDAIAEGLSVDNLANVYYSRMNSVWDKCLEIELILKAADKLMDAGKLTAAQAKDATDKIRRRLTDCIDILSESK